MRKRYLKIILLSTLFCLLPAMEAFASSPSISITSVSPGPAPYTFTFSVSDGAGLASITVNGRELGPSGGTYYDAEWSSYYPGTFTITATNEEGNSSSKSVSVPDGNVSAEQTAPAETTQAVEPPTVPDIVPETTPVTTAAPTVPETTPPETKPAETTTAPVETSPAKTEPETTAETEPELQTEPSETETIIETTQDQTVPETEAVTVPETVKTPDISGIFSIETNAHGMINVPKLMPLAPLVNKAAALHTSLAVRPPAAVIPMKLLAFAEAKGENVTFTTPEVPDIREKVMLASEKSDRIGQIHKDYTTVSMLTYKEGDHTRMPYYIAILLLAVIALYNLSVVILNVRRLRLYKAYVLALSGKRKTDPETLISQAIEKQETEKRRSRSRNRHKRIKNT